MGNNNQKSKLVLDYLNKDEIYTDGTMVEDEIIRIIKTSNKKSAIEEELQNNPTWAKLAHLSRNRQNLLSWYPFKKEASLLEVGSGFGAMTGLFCNKVSKVTSIELTKKRAEATAIRHRDNSNLTVIAGNLNQIDLKEKYDYVVVIGVLEYMGRYYNTDNPFLEFLKELKSHLKDDGCLILAIENKFGLKYWSGAGEDHTGRINESIEDYPGQKEVQTFSKEEVDNLLKSAGFLKKDFYYPVPDYKFPVEIFSDEYLPTSSHNVQSNVFPYTNLDHPREYYFNEKLVNDSIVKENKFDFFANSFLIFAKKGKK